MRASFPPAPHDQQIQECLDTRTWSSIFGWMTNVRAPLVFLPCHLAAVLESAKGERGPELISGRCTSRVPWHVLKLEKTTIRGERRHLRGFAEKNGRRSTSEEPTLAFGIPFKVGRTELTGKATLFGLSPRERFGFWGFKTFDGFQNLALSQLPVSNKFSIEFNLNSVEERTFGGGFHRDPSLERRNWAFCFLCRSLVFN